MQLIIIDIATTQATILFFLAGGMMIAINIPYSPTLSALTMLAGSMFPKVHQSRFQEPAGDATSTMPYIYAGLSFSGTDTHNPNISSVTKSPNDQSVKKRHFVVKLLA